jgi:anion-transporting  ArsA/GET3 family ATPase
VLERIAPGATGTFRESQPLTQRSILDRRLVIVTGKGGTGKTTVAATLGWAAAQAGRRVLVVETGSDENVSGLLGAKGPAVGYEERPLPSGPTVLRIEPYEALGEYLGLQLGGRLLVSRLIANRGFRQLMDASPGWRELITLGKVWHLEQAQEAGRQRWDLLVVDAPATGHGLTFLDVPRVVVQAVRAGPLRRHAGWVEAMVQDPERTLLLPVALAEELPARETVELVTRLRNEVGLAVDRVVVNAVVEDPFPPSVPDLDRRLAELGPDALPPELPAPGLLARCAAHLRSRFEMHRHHLEGIARETRLPLVVLPALPTGVAGVADLALLAPKLLAEPEDLA